MSDDNERIAPRSPREETSSCSPDDAGEISKTKDVADKATVQGGAASHRFKTRNLVIGVAACAVAFCALLTGVGYGLGWFSGDESTDENPASAFVSGSANQSSKDHASESSFGQEDSTVNANDSAEIDADAADDLGESNASDEADSNVGSDMSQSLENEAENASEDPNADAASGGSNANADNTSAPLLVGTTDSGTSGNSGSGTSSPSSQGQGSSSTQKNNQNSNSTGSSGTESSGNSNNTNSSTKTISVSVYIDSSRAVPYGWDSCLGDTTVTITEGSSVYDALKATGLAIGGSGSYVASISGLAERACGSGSGWLYYVNGVSPGCSCSQYKLSGGEDIKWIYTCNMGNDI